MNELILINGVFKKNLKMAVKHFVLLNFGVKLSTIFLKIAIMIEPRLVNIIINAYLYMMLDVENYPKHFHILEKSYQKVLEITNVEFPLDSFLFYIERKTEAFKFALINYKARQKENEEREQEAEILKKNFIQLICLMIAELKKNFNLSYLNQNYHGLFSYFNDCEEEFGFSPVDKPIVKHSMLRQVWDISMREHNTELVFGLIFLVFFSTPLFTISALALINPYAAAGFLVGGFFALTACSLGGYSFYQSYQKTTCKNQEKQAIEAPHPLQV